MIKLSEIFWIFFKLGCTSFGGPAAHFIFFKHAFVEQKKWLSAQAFSEFMALTQLLPGPSSSQMGMIIGYQQRKYLGALMAWLGFTLPSTFLMIVFAILLQHQFLTVIPDFIKSISLIVLAIVSFAFWQMLRSYCHKTWHYLAMLSSTICLSFSAFSGMQFLIILVAIVLGILISIFSTRAAPINSKKTLEKDNISDSKQQFHSFKAQLWLIIFLLSFVILGTIQYISPNTFSNIFLKFYSTGTLVFGGGHVVLPMLQQDFVATQQIPLDIFNLGYSLAQFMPGPLFTFASYLGAYLPITTSVWLNGIIATCAIFIPSFFLVFASLPYWSTLLRNKKIQMIVQSVNASVVGFLLATIIPLAQKSMTNGFDLIIVLMMLISLYKKISIFISIPSLVLIHYVISSSLI